MTNPNNLRPGGAAVNCTGDCTTCGRHFISDRAFDKHRQGEFEVTTEKGKLLAPNTRHCVDPDTIPGMEYFKGRCKQQPGVEVIIWRMTREGK